MRFTSQHKGINQKEYGKAVFPLRYYSLALILYWYILSVYGKQSEKISRFAYKEEFCLTHFLGHYRPLKIKSNAR